MSDKMFMTWEAAVSWLMTQPDKQQLVLDCYYDASVHEAAERYHQSLEWQAIQKLIPTTPGMALDLGAGRGIASYALAKDGWRVAAVEPDDSNLVGAGAIQSLADANQLPISVSRDFGERIQFESNTFDLVFARQVLHHANQLDQLCMELFRVLKPGGTFIAVRDHVISSHADLPKFYEAHPLHYLYGGENAYTMEQYLAAMRQAGFEIKRVMRPFDSVINYSPYTYETLRQAIKARLSRIPLLGWASAMLNADVVFNALLRLLSWLDKRPGRLCSFVCVKPLKS
ncbi:class I SAM-dependent methyltransferase [Methylobacillus sp. Pita1]|uniref:class I SAM-dependent methyltransferase n=1 Tax=Methylobacillus sp. Pita1 TaxID=3382642 RepID=UPI0038B64742